LEQVTEEVRELSRPDREQLLARLIRDLEPSKIFPPLKSRMSGTMKLPVGSKRLILEK